MAVTSFIDTLFGGFLRRSSGSPLKEIGRTGTPIFGGFLTEAERNPKLTGSLKYQTYSDILANISIVAASARHFLNLVAAVDWHAEPAKDGGEAAKEMADFVNNVMQDMETPFFRVIRRGAMFRYYGFSIQEWTAKKRDDGSFGFRDIAPRPQNTIHRWDTEVGGKVLGVTQLTSAHLNEIYLPRVKIIYFVDDSLNDSPEGFGLFRQLAEPANRLKTMQRLEQYGYEMDLKGVPIGRAPLMELIKAVAAGEISQKDADKELLALSTFIQRHIKNPELGMILDSQTWETSDESQRPSGARQWDIETMTSDSAEGSQAVGMAIERVQREMARITGTEGLLIGGDGKGSMALSKDKTSQIRLVTDSTIREQRHTLNNDFIGTLWTLNGFDKAIKPTFKTDLLSHRDIAEITGALQDLATAGAPLEFDDPAVDQIRDLLGLDRVPKDITRRVMDALLNPVVEGEPDPDPTKGEDE